MSFPPIVTEVVRSRNRRPAARRGAMGAGARLERSRGLHSSIVSRDGHRGPLDRARGARSVRRSARSGAAARSSGWSGASPASDSDSEFSEVNRRAAHGPSSRMSSRDSWRSRWTELAEAVACSTPLSYPRWSPPATTATSSSVTPRARTGRSRHALEPTRWRPDGPLERGPAARIIVCSCRRASPWTSAGSARAGRRTVRPNRARDLPWVGGRRRRGSSARSASPRRRAGHRGRGPRGDRSRGRPSEALASAPWRPPR